MKSSDVIIILFSPVFLSACACACACAYQNPTQPTTVYAPPPVTFNQPQPIIGDVTAHVYGSSGRAGAPMWIGYDITRSLNAPEVVVVTLSFGDGSTLELDPVRTHASFEHTYGTVNPYGSFLVTLTVTDALGRTTVATGDAYIS